MALKERISSPLEAGTSILDTHRLPPYLVPALENVSSKLARKAMHVTLVVVRRDYQLPSVVPPAGPPGLPTPTTSSSPRFGIASSPVATLRHLVRSGSINRPVRLKTDAQQTSAASPSTLPSSGLDSPRMRWTTSPTTPPSPPPLTPCTASSTTADTTGLVSSNSCRLRLVHPAGLLPREKRMLSQALQRAEAKFNIGRDWLPSAASPAACGLTDQLIHRSIVQNEVLFSSEGLTLLSLDRLYSLKAALAAYSKTGHPLRLEDAVDELRRLVLASNGRKVTKAGLLRSYDWLNVSQSAISDLDQTYKRAYGGPEAMGAIAGMVSGGVRVIPEPVIRSDDDGEGPEDFTGIALTTCQASEPLSPKGPILKLQTNLDPPPKEKGGENVEDEDGDRTARTTDRLSIVLHPWNASSIDEVLSADVQSSGRNSMRLGPMTPNGDDDISPTTRGEWGFLMVDNAFQGGRTVTVETC